jgi:hypothetical protein
MIGKNSLSNFNLIPEKDKHLTFFYEVLIN